MRLQSIFTVSGITLVSRILGLGRDMLTAAALGVTSWTNAFLFAFAIPNLFRRLLGEGALTSAFQPVLSTVLNDSAGDSAKGYSPEARQAAFRLLNAVLSWTALVLLGLSAAIAGVFILLASGIPLWVGTDTSPTLVLQWKSGLQMGAALVGYMVMICLAALLGATLNQLNRFAVHAASAIWLNLVMILALGIGMGAGLGDEVTVYLLCSAVWIGGFLQLVVPARALVREGWKPRLDFHWSESLKSVFQLFLPGVLGAAVSQINVLISRSLAFAVNDRAVTTLYLANRLIELPLGVFAIAVTTVFFPHLNTLEARRDEESYHNAVARALNMVIAMTLPAAAGLVVLSVPIMEVLFQYGSFTADDVLATAPVLAIYAVGLPFLGYSTLLTRVFHSRRDTRTPVRVAFVTFAVNLVLSVGLIPFMAEYGMAVANTVSALYQTVHLAVLSRLKCLEFKPSTEGRVTVWKETFRMVAAMLVMSLSCIAGNRLIDALGMTHPAGGWTKVLMLIPAGMAAYFGVLFLLKSEEIEAFRLLLKGRRKAVSAELDS